MADLDKPALSQDKAPETEQEDQQSWIAKIYSNLAKEAAGRNISLPESFKMPSPVMLNLENTRSLPVCRTSC